MTIGIRVRYVFGLLDGNDERDRIVQAPAGVTVFELLQQLGTSGLELLVAVNGESAQDGVELKDWDELTLIPAISGG